MYIYRNLSVCLNIKIRARFLSEDFWKGDSYSSNSSLLVMRGPELICMSPSLYSRKATLTPYFPISLWVSGRGLQAFPVTSPRRAWRIAKGNWGPGTVQLVLQLSCWALHLGISIGMWVLQGIKLPLSREGFVWDRGNSGKEELVLEKTNPKTDKSEYRHMDGISAPSSPHLLYGKKLLWEFRVRVGGKEGYSTRERKGESKEDDHIHCLPPRCPRCKSNS